VNYSKEVDTGDLILRLSAIARGLEDEGQLNLAKIFRAAAVGEIYRESRNRPRLGAGLVEAMRETAAEMSGRESASNSLTQAMSYAVEALERREMPLLPDIPNPLVCYQCGEVMLQDPPLAECPTCNARRYSFQKILPIYFFQQPLKRSQVESLLDANLQEVESIVAGIDEQTADQGSWPLREILYHLASAQNLMYGRARRMINEDNPTLVSVQPSDSEVSEPFALEQTLGEYRATRKEVSEWFHSLSDADLNRGGLHPEWGPFTVLSQVTYMVQHEQLHLAELEARREGR
jgi:hypothetical protein